MSSTVNYQIGDTIRARNYPTTTGFRVWKITGHYLGATSQESVYGLKPLDVTENGEGEILIPCLLLETHPLIERV